MTQQTRSRSLVRALRQLVPETDIALVHERPWHSLTFCGAQICLFFTLPEYAEGQRSTIAELLENNEFSLPGQLVADIAITETSILDGKHRLMIDALVLDD